MYFYSAIVGFDIYIYIDVQPKTDDIVKGSQMEWVIKNFLNTSKLQVG